MTLRRLALAITLLTAPVQADAPDFVAAEESPSQTEKDAWEERVGDDLVLWSDGTIAGSVRGYVPWSLLRLVIPDLGAGRDPTWIEIAPGIPHGGGDLTLRALRGAAVTGPRGEFLGVVHRCLVCVAVGRVLAVELETGEAIPWSMLHVPENGARPLTLGSSADTSWLRGWSR